MTSETDRQPDHTDQRADLDLLAAVGGYRQKRRPGWYLALILLGFGLGALLALAVGPQPPPADATANGAQATTAAPTPEPIRAGLVFSVTKDAPPETPDMLPARAKQVYCHFRLPGVKTVTTLTGTWSGPDVQGEIASRDFVGRIEKGIAIGHAVIPAPSPAGFQKGIYEVQVRTPDDVSREGSFVVVEDPAKILSHPTPKAIGIQVSNAAVCASVAENGRPRDIRSTFGTDTEKICVAFEFANAEPGSVVNVEWQFHGKAIPSATREITLNAPEGWGYAWIARGASDWLIPGSYRAIIKSVPDGEPLASANFKIKAAP